MSSGTGLVFNDGKGVPIEDVSTPQPLNDKTENNTMGYIKGKAPIENTNESKTNVKTTNTAPTNTAPTNTTLLQNFTNQLETKNIIFDENTILFFINSVDVNYLTLLSGTTGVGKTTIANEYCKHLNSKGLAESKFISITPTMTDPEDLIGYYDTRNQQYKLDKNGFTDFILSSNSEPDKLHIVIFDEMNLSRIEHWFAPLLSAMELPEEDRVLELHGEASKLYVRNNELIEENMNVPQSIKLGNNIRFIGTINMDESTSHLTKRLRDRANIIHISYTGSLFEISDNSMSNEFIELLNSINKACDDNYMDRIVSPRVFKSIQSEYKGLCKHVKNIDIPLAMDFYMAQIESRVITKLDIMMRKERMLLNNIINEIEKSNFKDLSTKLRNRLG